MITCLWNILTGIEALYHICSKTTWIPFHQRYALTTLPVSRAALWRRIESGNEEERQYQITALEQYFGKPRPSVKLFNNYSIYT